MPKRTFLFFFSFLFCFISHLVFAQVGIRASPLRFEEIVEPGEVLTKYIKVTNTSDFPQTFYLYVMDFKPRGEGGQAVLIPKGSEEGPYLSSWIQVSKEGIEFQPGEEKQIPITFKVPSDIGPGGYYGAIVVGPQPPQIDPKEGVVIRMTHQVAILALFQVKGPVNEEARIREFTTDKTFYNVPFKVQFVTRIENLGNVHIKPVGVIEIKNFFGKKIAALNFNSGGANILPKTIRRFENSWSEEMGFGKYTASLVLNYGTAPSEGGEGIKTLNAQISFWILPLKIVIPGAFFFILFVVLLIFFIKAYKDKAIKKALEEAGLVKVKYVKKYEGPSPVVYLAIIVFILFILFALLIGLFVVLFLR